MRAGGFGMSLGFDTWRDIISVLIVLLWPEVQSASRRRAFRRLILRELEELAPFPPNAQKNMEWFQHLSKNFVYQAVFMAPSENRDFILSLPPDMVYSVYQLWDALKNRNQVQWLYFLNKLANPSFDKRAEIREAHLQWACLIDQYGELAQNSLHGRGAHLKDAKRMQGKHLIREQGKRPAGRHSPKLANGAVTLRGHTTSTGRPGTKRRT
jgi:hypothetical protein